MDWVELQLIIHCKEEQFQEIVEFVESKAKRYNLNISNASYRNVWYQTTKNNDELFLKTIRKKYPDIRFQNFPTDISDPNEEPEKQ